MHFFRCSISGSGLILGTEFELDPDQSETNIYVVSAQNVRANFNGNRRLWVQCSTGICTVAGHNYCKKVSASLRVEIDRQDCLPFLTMYL